MKKKFLSFVLTCLMTVASLPTMVNAEQSVVASIADLGYASLQETIDAATIAEENVVVLQFLDLAVEICTASGEKLGNYNELTEKLTFTVAIPEDMDKEGKTFVVIRVHNGEVTVLDTVMNEDGTLSFETDRFSTYAIAYKEAVNNTIIVDVETPLAGGNHNFGLFLAIVCAIAVFGVGAAVVVAQKKKSEDM